MKECRRLGRGGRDCLCHRAAERHRLLRHHLHARDRQDTAAGISQAADAAGGDFAAGCRGRALVPDVPGAAGPRRSAAGLRGHPAGAGGLSAARGGNRFRLADAGTASSGLCGWRHRAGCSKLSPCRSARLPHGIPSPVACWRSRNSSRCCYRRRPAISQAATAVQRSCLQHFQFSVIGVFRHLAADPVRQIQPAIRPVQFHLGDHDALQQPLIDVDLQVRPSCKT